MWFSGFVAGGLSSGSVQGVSVLVSFWWMWRFKNFVDIVVVVFSLRPSFFLFTFFFTLLFFWNVFIFFGFELFFACSTYFLLESLILAQDERWRRA